MEQQNQKDDNYKIHYNTQQMVGTTVRCTSNGKVTLPADGSSSDKSNSKLMMQSQKNDETVVH